MKFKIFTVLLISLFLVGCGSPNDDTESITTENSTSENTEVQEPYILTFEATDLEGEAFTSDVFQNSKLTMLNVWATYCNPCLSEMPDLGQIAVEYDAEDFQMIGIVSDVSVFDEEAAQSEVKALVEETGASTYPHLLLNQSLYENLVGAIDSVPTTFFVNQKGELLGYLTGSMSKKNWEAVINDLLAQVE